MQNSPMKPLSPFTIDGTTISPGETKSLKIKVARLPSTTPIYLRVEVIRALQPGPTLLVLGGVHGDEINGVEIVRRSLAGNYFSELLCGTVIVIPLLNIYGFINFSRDVPDGKDVNRSFPGSAKGSLASRVAYKLRTHILPHIDAAIDYHSGGASRYNYPQIRYTRGDASSEALARAFGAPFTLASKTIDGSLREEASKNNTSMLVFEGGESLRLDAHSIQVGLAGLTRVMKSLGMRGEAEPAGTCLHFSRSRWLRANRAGLFLWNKPSGILVTKGETLGHIHDPYGKIKVPVVSRKNGYIIGHNNAPVVSQGDALFHIAELSGK